MADDETTPLLNNTDPSDHHAHFCQLIGLSHHTNNPKSPYKSPAQTLYNRATRKRRSQDWTYRLTAALSNTLLLTQIILGATLTALGASSSSHILITIFGVLNTIIAGLVAYLKSRGQPMRARMFRDDLEHVVDEIENSKIMWLGIQGGVHGYDEIDVDGAVSVRSEVARLTRLYEAAVKKYVVNNPDMYSAGGGLLDAITGLRARPGAGAQIPPVVGGGAAAATTPAVGGAPIAVPPVADEDESPATAKVEVKADKGGDEAPSSSSKDDGKADDKGKDVDRKEEMDKTGSDADATAGGKDGERDSTPHEAESKAKLVPEDPDAEPASAAKLPKKHDNP
ncbi:hypothetical protein ACLMJK_008283 [Lecanora helva]